MAHSGVAEPSRRGPWAARNVLLELRRAAIALCLALAGCVANLGWPVDGLVACETSADCGGGTVCFEVTGYCVVEGTEDTEPPRVLQANATDVEHVAVSFTEPILGGLEDPDSYIIAPQLPVLAVTADSGRQSVSLTTAPQVGGTLYTLVVTGLRDAVGYDVAADGRTATFTGFGGGVDPSPPDLLEPRDGEILPLSDGAGTLRWSPRVGAAHYVVELYTDAELTEPWGEPRIVVGEASVVIEQGLAEVTYWWRVRSSLSDWSPTWRFAATAGSLYVHCPAASTCNAVGRIGSRSEPFERISDALTAVQERDEVGWRLRIAARDDAGTPYREGLLVRGGVSLEGGFDAGDWDAPRDPASHPTVIAQDSTSTLTVLDVTADRPTTLEGLTVVGGELGDTVALNITHCDTGLSVRDVIVEGGDTRQGTTFGIQMVASGSSGPGSGPRLERVEVRGGHASTVDTTRPAKAVGAAFLRSSPTVVDSIIRSGGGGQSASWGVVVRGSAPGQDPVEIAEPVLLHTIVSTAPADGETIALEVSENAYARIDRCRLESASSGPVEIGDAPRAAALWATLGGRVQVTNSVLISGTGERGTTYGAYFAGAASGPSIISSSTIVARPTGLTDVVGIHAGRSGLRVINSIIVTDPSYGIGIREPGAGLGLEAFENNLITDAPDALYLDYRSGGDCDANGEPGTPPRAWACVTTEVDLNSAAATTGGCPYTAGGNLGPETIPTAGDVGFVDLEDGDLRLSDATPAVIRDGGKDTRADTCGYDGADPGCVLAEGTGSCGPATVDYAGNPRPGPDGVTSIGAFEYVPGTGGTGGTGGAGGTGGTGGTGGSAGIEPVVLTLGVVHAVAQSSLAGFFSFDVPVTGLYAVIAEGGVDIDYELYRDADFNDLIAACESPSGGSPGARCMHNLLAGTRYMKVVPATDTAYDVLAFAVATEGDAIAPVLVTPEARHWGSVNGGSSVYGFATSIHAAHELRVAAFAPTPGDPSPLLTLRVFAGSDITGPPLCSSNGVMIPCRLSGLPVGAYTAVIEESTGAPAAYALLLHPTLGEGSSVQPVSLAVGVAHSGAVDGWSKSFYSFTIPAGGAGPYAFEFTSPDPLAVDGFTDLALLPFDTCLTSSPGACVLAGLEATTLYATVEPALFIDATYELTIVPASGEGSPLEPVSIPLDTPVAGAVDAYAASYYTFTTAGSGTYDVGFANATSGAVDWDVNSAPLSSCTATPPDCATRPLDAATSYQLVARGASVSETYEITVSKAPFQEGSPGDPIPLGIDLPYAVQLAGGVYDHYGFTAAAGDYAVFLGGDASWLTSFNVSPASVSCRSDLSYEVCVVRGLAAATPVAWSMYTNDAGVHATTILVADVNPASGCAPGALTCFDFEDGQVPADFIEPATSDRAWVIDGTAPGSGAFALASGSIANGARSCFEYTAPASTWRISFSVTTDTEASVDVLAFSIDGVTEQSFSGATSWRGYAAVTSPGAGHRYAWCYIKNGSGSAGADTVWVDDLELE